MEDSSSARRIFQDLLFRFGITTQNLRLAADASEALRIWDDWAPDLVFLDMELRPPDGGFAADRTSTHPSKPRPPVMGDELAQELWRRNPELEIVLVTAIDEDDARVRALKRDGAQVIVKPVRAARVQEVLNRLGFPVGTQTP